MFLIAGPLSAVLVLGIFVFLELKALSVCRLVRALLSLILSLELKLFGCVSSIDGAYRAEF